MFKKSVILMFVFSAISTSSYAMSNSENCQNLLVQGQYQQAVTPCQTAAKQGNAYAQFKLGAMYVTGQGVAQDYKQAFYWHQKAAQQGNKLAQFSLGVMHSHGLGVVRDDKKAVYWYQKAAQQGYAEAQYSLGVAYHNGQGVPKNYKLAYMWLWQAKQQGYEDAVANIYSVKKLLNPTDLAQAEKMAKQCQASNYQNCAY